MSTVQTTWCKNCGGDGYTSEPGPCPACKGTGKEQVVVPESKERRHSVMWRWDGAILHFKEGDKIRVRYKGKYEEGVFVAEPTGECSVKVGIRYKDQLYRSPSAFCLAVGSGVNPRDHAEIWQLDEQSGWLPAWFVRDNYTPDRKLTGRERHMKG